MKKEQPFGCSFSLPKTATRSAVALPVVVCCRVKGGIPDRGVARTEGGDSIRAQLYCTPACPVCQTFFLIFCSGKSQAKNAVLFQQTILRYFVHFGQHEKATRQSPAGSLCFIVLFPCYFRVLCVRFSLKYERAGAARPPPPSTRPAPCSHSARLKPSLGSCSSRFGFARSPPVIPRRASSPSGATAG